MKYKHIIDKLYYKILQNKLSPEELMIYIGVAHPSQDEVEWTEASDFPRHERTERYNSVQDWLTRHSKY